MGSETAGGTEEPGSETPDAASPPPSALDTAEANLEAAEQELVQAAADQAREQSEATQRQLDAAAKPASTVSDTVHAQGAVVKVAAYAAPLPAALPSGSHLERLGSDVLPYLTRTASSLQPHERHQLAHAKARMQAVIDHLTNVLGV